MPNRVEKQVLECRWIKWSLLLMIVGFLMPGGAALANAPTTEIKKPNKRFATKKKALIRNSPATLRSVLRDLRNKSWWISCKRVVGTLRKDRVIQGIPCKGGEVVVLYLYRETGYSTGQRCNYRQPLCRGCDRCAQICQGGKRWTFPIIGWSLRSSVLAKSHEFSKITFTKGTVFSLNPNGTLRTAVLRRSQPLRHNQSQRTLPFPQGIQLEFHRKHRYFQKGRLRLPNYRLFKLGPFTCFYKDGKLGVLCEF